MVVSSLSRQTNSSYLRTIDLAIKSWSKRNIRRIWLRNPYQSSWRLAVGGSIMRCISYQCFDVCTYSRHATLGVKRGIVLFVSLVLLLRRFAACTLGNIVQKIDEGSSGAKEKTETIQYLLTRPLGHLFCTIFCECNYGPNYLKMYMHGLHTSWIVLVNHRAVKVSVSWVISTWNTRA